MLEAYYSKIYAELKNSMNDLWQTQPELKANFPLHNIYPGYAFNLRSYTVTEIIQTG